MIEGLDKENIKITGYALPKSLSIFEEGEVRNAFFFFFFISNLESLKATPYVGLRYLYETHCKLIPN